MTIIDVKLADFGEGVHEAEILQWLVKEGDSVKREQPLVEIHTEKVNDEVVSPTDGKVVSLEKAEGDIVKVGEILVKIDGKASSKSESKDKGITETKEKKEKDDSLFTPVTEFKRGGQRKPETIKAPPKQESKIVNEKVLASPAIRRKARERNIDLRYIRGSGPAGRITEMDLDSFSSGGEMGTVSSEPDKFVKAIVPGSETRIPLKGTRKTIANAMHLSKTTAAHYTYFEEVNMSALDELRNKLKPTMQEKGIKVTYVALVMKLLVPALKKFPLLNSQLDEEKSEIILRDYYNIGISVDTEDGLIVPVVKNVEQKTLWEVAAEVQDFAQRARDGKLKLSDISGGTFTITSIGNIGGVMATPIIKQPESAILGLMKAKLRPVVETNPNGGYSIVAKPIMYLSLSLDHRIVDGAVGARFINELIKYMEHPELLYLEMLES